MLESESDIDDYQYHLGTLWSGMDFNELAVKHEPASPNGMGMSQCSRAPLEELSKREFSSDFPITDDYGSDQGGDSSGNSSGEISPPGNISPDMSGKMMDFDHTKLMMPDFSPPDGGGGGGVLLDYQPEAVEEQDCVEGGLKRQCRVCFDVASGYHYGVSSCEACKAFFKRTIQGNIEYSCPAKGECEITKRRRKACQACRFQKCLRVGMLREGVRLDRVRGGRQKYKRNENGTTYIQPLTSSSIPKKPCIETGGGTSLLDNRYLSTLMALENQLDKLYVSKDYSIEHGDEDVMFRAAICDVADRELVITISWAKQMPGFSHLELKQQMLLLQNSWLEVMCLNLVWRSCPYQGSVLFAEDLQVPEEKAEACQIPPQLDSQIRKVCQRFTTLGVSREEYVLLKAIILCNYDDPDELGIRNLQDRLQDSLIDCIRAQRLQGATNPNSSRRLGQLFLVLPAITRIKLLYKQFWDLLKMDCRVMMHNLFLEMLDSSS